ncbi:NAD-dependent epimerase/dehydratase family protein [Neoroseomonas soli]|nr:NAD-dependent epimerase/dehydratase family protein [Neoroseomonas soli]
MSYLVTGGCGFIGSHLVDALVARGDRVRVVDDLSTGHRENLAPGVELLEGDVGDRALLREAMEGVAGCFHLAAIASVERGVREWCETHRVNLSATIAVFDEAARIGGLPVVYASSAAVYGSNADLPLVESAVTRPLSAYGADKLGCELHARVAGVVHGIPTLGLRFFNVYGPRQDPKSPYSGVISVFCDRMLRGLPLDIYGDGRQTRDFVFVTDVQMALLAAMDAASTDAHVLNVCTGQATNVLHLAETLGEIFGVSPATRHLLPRAGEIRHSLGSPIGARRTLDLPSPRSLGDGLREVVNWLRSGSPPRPPPNVNPADAVPASSDHG